MDKKTLFSGIQPSGKITLGNYLGSLSNWVNLQKDYNCIFSIVDMHAITVPQNPKDLRENALLLLAQYISAGIDIENCTIFIQSHVSSHAELSWVLSTMTYIGELSRMTQFKEKSKKNDENLNAGLLTYPVLMAADILLYNTDFVPVGSDQKQHLELARTLANRFNNRYSPTFVVPDGIFPKTAARVMSLQDPSKKMSKSDENENGFISLMDSNDAIVRKIKRAVTDSKGEVDYNDEQLGIKNLLEIYSSLSGKTVQSLVEEYRSKGYGVLKADTADVIISVLEPIRTKTEQYLKDRAYLEEVYSKGAQKARKVAEKTMRKVYKKIGFLPYGGEIK